MNRVSGFVIAGLVLVLGVTPSWGVPPNPTPSDSDGNTAGGTNALANVTSGLSNTAFGASALRFSNGSANTAAGNSALSSNTTGSFNTASGAFALTSNTTGRHNTACGNEALLFNATGNNNTASGSSALARNTTGSDNTAGGFNALLSNTAPPDGSTTGLRFAISQSGRSAVFATLMVTYDNGVIPSVSARWIRMPSTRRAGQIEVTRGGVPTIVYFAYPDLSPAPGAASVKRSLPTTTTALAHPTLATFSTTTIKKDLSLFEQAA